jgi:DNA-binding NarL/FixJ family response regulator
MDRKVSPRLLIADDHRLMAEACEKMLQPEFNVVGVVTDGRALVHAALELKPDAAIVDVSIPHLNGLDAGEQIKRKLPLLKLVFLSMNADPAVAAEAFRRGASAYILKHSGAEEFMAAIRRVMRGHSYLSPLIARETLTYLLERPQELNDEKRITQRQSEILQLLAEGRSMKEVAAILDLAPGTVAFHKYNMMERLGITTNAGLLLYAMKHFIVAGSPQ